MKTHVYFSDFCRRFQDHDRQDQFSLKAKRVLFDHLEHYEEETGEEIKLDVVALCCEYAELTVEEICDAYNIETNGEIEDMVEKAMEFLGDATMVCGITSDNTIVFQQC